MNFAVIMTDNLPDFA